MSFIQSIPNPSAAILSHHHKDHTGNILKVKINSVYVGDYTRERLGFGAVIAEKTELEEGITLIPCPSVHTPGSLLLNVYGEYCLIGDLFFCKKPVSIDLAREMIEALAQVETKYFVVSHSGTENIFERKRFLLELKKEFE